MRERNDAAELATFAEKSCLLCALACSAVPSASSAQPRRAGDRRRDDEGHVRVRDLSGRGAEDRRAHRRAREARLLRRSADPSRAAGLPRAVGRSAVARSDAARPTGAAAPRRRAARRLASPRSARSARTRGAPSAMAHPGNPGARRQSDLRDAGATGPNLNGRLHRLRPRHRGRRRAGDASSAAT